MVGHQYQWVLDHRFALLAVGDEVWRNVALVELHSLDQLECGLHPFRFLDGDDTVLPYLADSVGNQLANFLVVIGRNSGNLLDDLIRLDRGGRLLQLVDHYRYGLVEAVFQVDRRHACRNATQPVGCKRLRQDCRGAGTVAGGVLRLARDFLDQLRAHVFVRVRQLDILGNCHTIVDDGRAAE